MTRRRRRGRVLEAPKTVRVEARRPGGWLLPSQRPETQEERAQAEAEAEVPQSVAHTRSVALRPSFEDLSMASLNHAVSASEQLGAPNDYRTAVVCDLLRQLFRANPQFSSVTRVLERLLFGAVYPRLDESARLFAEHSSARQFYRNPTFFSRVHLLLQQREELHGEIHELQEDIHALGRQLSSKRRVRDQSVRRWAHTLCREAFRGWHAQVVAERRSRAVLEQYFGRFQAMRLKGLFWVWKDAVKVRKFLREQARFDAARQKRSALEADSKTIEPVITQTRRNVAELHGRVDELHDSLAELVGKVDEVHAGIKRSREHALVQLSEGWQAAVEAYVGSELAAMSATLAELPADRLPDLGVLLEPNEPSAALDALDVDRVLLRWVRYQLARVHSPRTVQNFSGDLRDSEALAYLLWSVSGSGSSGSADGEPAGVEPAGSEPSGSEPSGSEPSGSEPAADGEDGEAKDGEAGGEAEEAKDGEAKDDQAKHDQAQDDTPHDNNQTQAPNPSRPGFDSKDPGRRARELISRLDALGVPRLVTPASLLRCDADLNVALVAFLFERFPALPGVARSPLGEAVRTAVDAARDEWAALLSTWNSHKRPLVTGVTLSAMQDRLVEARHALRLFAEHRAAAAPLWARVCNRVRHAAWHLLLARGRGGGQPVAVPDHKAAAEVSAYSAINTDVPAVRNLLVMDLELARREVTDDAVRGVAAGVQDALRAHHAELKRIFRHYAAAGEGFAGTMDADELWTFVKDCKIHHRQVLGRKHVLDLYHEIAEDFDGPEANGELEPTGFVHMLICLAGARFAGGAHNALTLVEKLEKLLEEMVLANACRSNAGHFRAELATDAMHAVVHAFSERLEALYKEFAAPVMTARTLNVLLDARGLIDSAFGLADLAAICKNVQQDDDLAMGGAAAELNFTEFVEALVAVAVYRYPDPFVPLATRFEGFLAREVFPP